jgi:hypothetical protein
MEGFQSSNNPFGEGQGDSMNVFTPQQLNQMNPQQQMQLIQAMKQRGILPNQINQLQLLQLQQQQQHQRLLYQMQQQKQSPLMGTNLTMNQQQQLRVGQRMIPQQTMMQMVLISNKTGIQSSPQFQNPGTPQLPQSSPSMQQAGMMNLTSNMAGSPPNNILFSNQVRPVMVNGMSPNLMQNQQQLLARNFALQQHQQKMNPGIATRNPLPILTPSNVTNSISNLDTSKNVQKSGTAAFPIAPTQSTRCFFTQPLHGLIDSSTLFQTGFQNTNSIVLGQKMESSNLFGVKDYTNEIQPILNPSGVIKRKLESILDELDCSEEIDSVTEDVLIFELGYITICRLFH